MTYVVDTHALVWFLEGNSRLSMAARNALTDTTVQVVVPTIVLAEITFLYARHRVIIDLPHVLAHTASAANCLVYPLVRLPIVSVYRTVILVEEENVMETACLTRLSSGYPTSQTGSSRDSAGAESASHTLPEPH